MLTGSCLGNSSFSQIVLTGSTPGDDLIKSLLTINSHKQVDFIRWGLTLNAEKTYLLKINFGESEPNTNGFKNGGEKLSLTGVYTQKGNVYELRNEKTQSAISLVKLNENLFHLLTPDNKLMIGNGGWSYTLNKKDFSANDSQLFDSRALAKETGTKIIFDGRTPCDDFTRQFNLPVSNQCIKLKWKLTLFRDVQTNEPTTFTLNSTFNRAATIEGKWRIVKEIKGSSEAIIYQIDLAELGETLSFLVGDENVLFFLDKKNQLLTGNSDFSFTLNRRK